jgi:hypothetical protein
MSGRRAKYLRKILRGELGSTSKKLDPVSRKIYRRLKKKFVSLNKEQKSKYKIQNYV